MGLSRNGSIFYNRQFLALLFVGLVSACQYASLGPSLWPFLNQKFCADKFVLGLCTSLYYTSSAIAAPIAAYFYRHRVFRAQGIVSFSIVIFANLLYAQAEQMHGLFENGGPITIGFCRFFIGLSSFMSILTISWIGEHGTSEEQTAAVTAMSAMFSLGFTTGSAVGGLASMINFQFNIGSYVVIVDKYTAPAYIAIVLNVISMAVFLWMCHDCDREAREAANEERARLVNSGSVNDTEDPTTAVSSASPNKPGTSFDRNRGNRHARSITAGGIHSAPTSPADGAVSPPSKGFLSNARRDWEELGPVLPGLMAAMFVKMGGLLYIGAQNIISPLVLQDYGLSVGGLGTFMTARGTLSLIGMFLLIPIGKRVSMGAIMCVTSLISVLMQCVLVNPHLYSFETRPVLPDPGRGCHGGGPESLDYSIFGDTSITPIGGVTHTPTDWTMSPTPRSGIVVMDDIASFPVYFSCSMVLSVMYIGSETMATSFVSRLTHGLRAQSMVIGVRTTLAQVILLSAPMLTTQVLNALPNDRFIIFIFLAFLKAVVFISACYLWYIQKRHFGNGIPGQVVVDMHAASCGTLGQSFANPSFNFEPGTSASRRVGTDTSDDRLPLLRDVSEA